ncbi:unnamed protein product [Effrenium voratum]|uniref:Methyltransferase FkbM domain-containing protein n=1 Tax=Effrenium voratum TaxID=2562239 RepID=A0AA36NG85_9DINO|nr:unnamed protein product [Effrenium voratum]
MACAAARTQLHLRLPWPRLDVQELRRYQGCPDVLRSLSLVQLTNALLTARSSLLGNASNSTVRARRLGAKRRLQEGLVQLRNLLEAPLARRLAPAAPSDAAAFFRAAGLAEAARRLAPPLFRRKLPRRAEGWWQTLKQHLGDDTPLALDDRESAPCTALRAAQLLAAAEALRAESTLSLDWSCADGRRVRELLTAAQRHLLCLLSGDVSWPLLLWEEVLVFHLLDRLDCRVWAPVEVGGPPFWMRLLPSRNVEANYVRGAGGFHCDQAFRSFVEAEKSPLLVEVGASLGGCTLHVLTRHPGARAVAIEPYRPAAMALKRTAENGLADRLQVVEAFVSDQPGACRMSSQQAGQDWVVHQNWQLTPGPAESGCQVVTLDEIFSGLGPLGEQDVLLRLHVDGRELQVLRSLTAVSRVARAAVALWPARDDSPAGQEAYAPEKVAQWLWGHGFRLRLVYSHEGLLAELKDEEAVWALQSRRVPTVDTMTLLAERPQRDRTEMKRGNREDRRKKAVLLEPGA